MASATFRQGILTLQSRGYFSNSSLRQENGMASCRMNSKGVKLDIALTRRDACCSRRKCFDVVQASTSKITVPDPLLLCPSNDTSKDSKKKSCNAIPLGDRGGNKRSGLKISHYMMNEAALILVRHGESMWNERNLFAGCVDVPLTNKGVEEAIEAGKRISSLPVDMIFTSALIRAQMTAMLAMIEHRRKKVPVILHNENDRAREWSQIFSEDTKKECIPVITAWQLNERMSGELQGLNKQETADRYGSEQVHAWRRSYNTPPPNGESLEMCAKRAVAYFTQYIEPQLLAGKDVMIAAHGNSLRSTIMYLDKLTAQEVTRLELSTGVPMLYICKDGRYIRRGSPAEASVYASTDRLAQYRQMLDEKYQS